MEESNEVEKSNKVQLKKRNRVKMEKGNKVHITNNKLEDGADQQGLDKKEWQGKDGEG